MEFIPKQNRPEQRGPFYLGPLDDYSLNTNCVCNIHKINLIALNNHYLLRFSSRALIVIINIITFLIPSRCYIEELKILSTEFNEILDSTVINLLIINRNF